MLVTDGIRLTVPLFHGTSNIFLSEIRTTGLGAINPHVRLETLNFLGELKCSAEQYVQDHALSQPENKLFELILNQGISAANFNFRHGTTYFTPSRFTAVRYALRNRYGSELLSTAFYLFEKLSAIDYDAALEIAGRYPEAYALFHYTHEPVLIEVRDIAVQQLRSEAGGEVNLWQCSSKCKKRQTLLKSDFFLCCGSKKTSNCMIPYLQSV